MNALYGVISLLVTFSLVVIIEKLFKKEGLYAWISMAIIAANIAVCKNIDFLGINTNLGLIIFSSNFLATDILTEKYGKDDSKKAVMLGLCSQIIFIILMQITLAYIPSADDLVDGSMKSLFSINLRVSVASVFMYFVSSMLNIYLFDKIKQKYPKQLWIRNNVSTIISNCLENYIFYFLAFVGIYGMDIIMTIASIATVFEIVISLLDTPFLYLSKGLDKYKLPSINLKKIGIIKDE